MTNPIKIAIRNTNIKLRKNLSPKYIADASKKINTRIMKLEQYQQAKKIAFYMAINGEVVLKDLILSASLQGKDCYLPALSNENTLVFLNVSTTSKFCKNRFGIEEPDESHEHTINPKDLDIIFLPLVAFDNNGTRLGMGGGYYDRTLEKTRANLLIGVAYEFQLESFIKSEGFDIPLDIVVTEKKTYWCK
jgi:5-formyltetrahydrofolate cyclo-ligase